MSKALVVYSGGQDSTTCLFWAKKHFDEVLAIAFNYGQRHITELDAAKKIASEAGHRMALRTDRNVCYGLSRSED